MRKLRRLLLVMICSSLAFVPSAFAKKSKPAGLPAKILEASSVYVDCVCPRALGAAQEIALQQLQAWGRFKIADNRKQTDLVLLFSGNPYLGDYITRDGPDKRYVAIDSTIMTVIDPNTGESLWTDSRRWGSWRVKGATKDLIEELREQVEAQITKLSLNDILMCSVIPVYAGFGHLTAQEALAKANSAGGEVSAVSDHLVLTSAEAPPFCARSEFVFNSDHRIVGFQVAVSRAYELDINEVLQHADRFDFSGGKYAGDDQTYFTARSKDKRLLIEFNVESRRAILSRVSYFY